MASPSPIPESVPRCGVLERRIASFEQQNRALGQRVEKLIAELESERRQNKRQAEPFAKGLPSAPSKPGRKRG